MIASSEVLLRWIGLLVLCPAGAALAGLFSGTRSRGVAKGASLALAWVTFLAWAVALWALARLPESARLARWTLGFAVFEMPVGLAIDALSASMGATLALIAALAQTLAVSRRSERRLGLLPAALGGVSCLLLAGHIGVLWLGWTSLTVLLILTVRRSPQLPGAVAVGALGDMALIFALMRMVAAPDLLTPIAIALLLAMGSRLVLLSLCATRGRLDADGVYEVQALAVVGLLPSAIYMLLRYQALWQGLVAIGAGMQWAGLGLVALLAVRLALEVRPRRVLCGWLQVEVLLLAALAPSGNLGTLHYQGLFLLLASAALVPLTGLVAGEDGGLPVEDAQLAAAGLALAVVATLGFPALGGYHGRSTLLTQALAEKRYLLVAGALGATWLIARRLGSMILRGLAATPSAPSEETGELSTLAWGALAFGLLLVPVAGLFASAIAQWTAPQAVPLTGMVAPLREPLSLLPALAILLGAVGAWRGERRRARWRVDGQPLSMALPLSAVPRDAVPQTILVAPQEVDQWLATVRQAVDALWVSPEVLALLVSAAAVILFLWWVG